MTHSLPLRHLLLALAVVAIWGSNFVVIKYALDVLPPMLLAVLRFAIAFVPACFFLPRPAVGWRNLAAYGGFVAVGQFGLLYLAMRSEISPGLASLVIQTQVFFTLGLAVWLAKERVLAAQWLGLLLAVAGIGVIVAHTDGTTTPLGLAMVLAAAFSWACGNIVGKRAGQVNMLAYVVWSSAFAVPPLLVLALLVDGPDRIAAAPGPRCSGSPSPTRCSAMAAGAGCWPATRPRASCRWPCSCPSSAWAPRRCCWPSRCPRGS
jgi:O-acetylserine/cysteine efflux transporter